MLPLIMVILSVVLRVVPHPPNFAPVGATAVFAGRTMKPWMAMALVAVAMFLGDVVLARIHGYPLMSAVTPFVYGGFFVQAFLGYRWRTKKGGSIAAAGLGSAAFFLLSNLGVWICTTMYPPTPAGVVACYVAALPFYGATLAGDLIWTVVLSLLYKVVANRLGDRPFWVPVTTRELAPV